MASVAEQLKSARESRHLSVHRVAEITRMRSDHVQALEQGDYQVFVAPVYVRGFVRAYARCVHLDEEAIMADLDRELAGPPGPVGQRSHARPGGEEPAAGSRFSWPRWRWQIMAPVGAGAMLALGGFLLTRMWWTSPANDPLAGVAPGFHRGPAAAETLPLPADVAP